jgi:Domain of unknown function (DUF4304)
MSRIGKPTARNLVTYLAKNYFDPVLLSHGFQRSGLICNRRLPCLVHVLDIQLSNWSGGNSAEFTMNLGVWIEQVWRVCWDKAVPTTLKETDCFPRWRVADVLGSAKDVWWTVASHADVEVVGIELQDILLNQCIPFMDSLDSIGAVVAVAEDPVLRRFPAELLSYAILKHLSGEPKAASRILRALLADPEAEIWRARVSGIIERLTNSAHSSPCRN